MLVADTGTQQQSANMFFFLIPRVCVLQRENLQAAVVIARVCPGEGSMRSRQTHKTYTTKEGTSNAARQTEAGIMGRVW